MPPLPAVTRMPADRGLLIVVMLWGLLQTAETIHAWTFTSPLESLGHIRVRGLRTPPWIVGQLASGAGGVFSFTAAVLAAYAMVARTETLLRRVLCIALLLYACDAASQIISVLRLPFGFQLSWTAASSGGMALSNLGLAAWVPALYLALSSSRDDKALARVRQIVLAIVTVLLLYRAYAAIRSSTSSEMALGFVVVWSFVAVYASVALACWFRADRTLRVLIWLLPLLSIGVGLYRVSEHKKRLAKPSSPQTFVAPLSRVVILQSVSLCHSLLIAAATSVSVASIGRSPRATPIDLSPSPN